MAKSKRSVEKAEFWRLLVAQQRQEGVSVREFCRQKAISEPSFYAWRKKLRKRGAQREECGSQGRLIPVEVVNSASENNRPGACRNLPLEIGTPGGFTLRFDHETPSDTVARLLETIVQCPVGQLRMPMQHADEGGASC